MNCTQCKVACRCAVPQWKNVIMWDVFVFSACYDAGDTTRWLACMCEYQCVSIHIPSGFCSSTGGFHLSLVSTSHQNVNIWRSNEPEWWVKHSCCLDGFGWLSIKLNESQMGVKLWSHILPGAGGSHSESPLKAVAQASSSHVDFASPGPSYCDNPPSGLLFFNVTINRQSPSILSVFFFFF